jgi:5'/3'-nucleotidase
VAGGTFEAVIILVSNDDGIRAAGIRALAAALESVGEVWIVAPDREQSAASHSLSLHRPLRVEQLGPRRFAIDGTPTDCVNLAINGIMPVRPSLVVSGINHGANMGDDITYSGTVSAAMEGTLLNVPSIAVSLAWRDELDFTTAAQFAQRLAKSVLQYGLPRDTLLNVNVPSLPASELRGYLVTRQGKRKYGDAIVEKVDPRGKKYYWIGGEDLGFVAAEGTDFTAVEGGYISVTPLHMDLTNYASIAQVNELEVSWP